MAPAEPSAGDGARPDGGVVAEFEPSVNGKRAVIGFGMTGVIAFAANYLGDTNGSHAARGTYIGVVFVIIGLSLTWWFARARAIG
jgi:hypothetical protein